MPNTPPALQASGTIRTSRFVKISGEFTCAECDANDPIIGVSYQGSNSAPIPDSTQGNAAISGQVPRLYGEGDECLLELGDTVSAGAYLKSDADGKGVPALTTGTTVQNVGAIALQDGVSGALIRVAVHLERRLPAAS